MDALEHKWNEIAAADEEDEKMTEYEYEKEKLEVFEFEDEDGVGEVEELTPPKVTSWIDPVDGKTMYGVMVTTNDLNQTKKKRKNIRCQFDDCAICYQPWTSTGDHQICCLPCGHIYGLSCIKKWLLQSSPCLNACPHCKTVCSSENVKLLYVPRLCTAAHQKASSSTEYFPFTKEGFYEFNVYEWLRQADAKKLQSYALKQLTDIKQQHHNAAAHSKFFSIWVVEWAKADAQARLGWQGQRVYEASRNASAWEREANKLGRLADALRRRADALERVTDAYTTRLDFFNQMCKEHHKRLAQQKKK